ncbi:MAG: ATP-dependent helicase/nuclease subunit A, partial [Verrucomicrobiales bacterium]
MVQNVLQNEMILASAGAGKTYQLTDRYVALMARGVEPERIIALTFTRKAAGEFFDSILVKLARAAASVSSAQKLASSVQMPDLTQSDFQAMLHKLTCRLHLLSLGTLDGFFASIIRSFPFEFGLGGGFEILDEHMIALEKGRVYGQVFQRSRTRQQEQRDFLEAFKLATFGSEESTLLRDLNSFIDDHHEVYLGAPGAAQWGNPQTIWPEGCPWLDGGAAPAVDLAVEVTALRDALDFEKMNQKQLGRWDEFIDEITLLSPGVPLPPAVSYLLPKLLESYSEMGTGEASITVFKKQALSEDACASLCRIVRTIVGREIENKLRQTRGIWMVLNQYEQVYSRMVRRRGKLTFYDLQLILGGGECLEHNRPLLTQRPDAQDRLRIDYRLDTRYDHWLLDEFQDTSYLQWSVIENLIDEAVQDLSGQRSLFQVGDLKQAIYAWRGGDVTLFDDIRDHYNRTGEEDRIVERPLNDSWRSGPAVIEMVNAVFGNNDMLSYLFPQKTVDRWRWGKHVSRHPDLTGFACFLQPTTDAFRQSADEQKDRRLDLMLEILREVDPVSRGLSCAVLVQTNKMGHEVVDWIRAHSDIPVSSESIVRIAEDNPANAALLDLLQFAAHPGDTFAWQHLMMTPFGKKLREPEWTQDR